MPAYPNCTSSTSLITSCNTTVIPIISCIKMLWVPCTSSELAATLAIRSPQVAVSVNSLFDLTCYLNSNDRRKKSKIWKWTFSRQPHFIPKLFLWPSNVMVATEKWLLWSFQWWVPRAGNDFGFWSVKHSAHQSDCLSSNILFLEWRFSFAWTDS